MAEWTIQTIHSVDQCRIENSCTCFQRCSRMYCDNSKIHLHWNIAIEWTFVRPFSFIVNRIFVIVCNCFAWNIDCIFIANIFRYFIHWIYCPSIVVVIVIDKICCLSWNHLSIFRTNFTTTTATTNVTTATAATCLNTGVTKTVRTVWGEGEIVVYRWPRQSNRFRWNLVIINTVIHVWCATISYSNNMVACGQTFIIKGWSLLNTISLFITNSRFLFTCIFFSYSFLLILYFTRAIHRNISCPAVALLEIHWWK